jgi:hypothetical protein
VAIGDKRGPSRTDLQREQDLVTEAALYLEGKHQSVIAEAVGITRQQVSYDINRILIPRWQRQSNANGATHIARELEKINHLEATYWEAWHASLKPKESRSTGTTDRQRTVQVPTAVLQAMIAVNGSIQGNGTLALPSSDTRATLLREERDGNAMYLMGVQWCIDRRIKLLGLDAPLKIDIEQRIRAIAITFGLDPDAAVQEAMAVIKEVRSASATPALTGPEGLLN